MNERGTDPRSDSESTRYLEVSARSFLLRIEKFSLELVTLNIQKLAALPKLSRFFLEARNCEVKDWRSLAGESRETMQPVSAIQCLITLSRPLIHVRRNFEHSLSSYTGADKLSS